MDGGQADHRSDLVAVTVQFVESGDAPGFQVGSDAIDHLVEISVRDAINLDSVVESGPDGMVVEFSLERLGQGGAPALDGRAGCARFIAQVVAVAHKGIDGAHGVPLRTAEEYKRVIEIFRTAPRDVPAVAK